MAFERVRRPLFPPGFAEGAFQAASTGGTKLVPYGISTVVRKTSAGGSTQLYTLNAPPRKGLEKLVICTNATSSRSVRVTTAAGCSIQSSAGNGKLTKITFKKANQGVYLLATSTSVWFVTGQCSTKSAALSS